jgi:uncharacterized protein YecE (DUF72 family)
MQAIRIGTAGWTIPKASFSSFQNAGSHLERYSQRLNAVEINSSFYRPHRNATYQRWAASVPWDFRFSVKVPRSITHDARLKNCEPLLDRFLSEVRGLGDKLGVLLLQLPPRAAFDNRAVADFVAQIQERMNTALAIEPRHPSWFTGKADTLLKSLRVARVAADPPRGPGNAMPGGCPDLVYYRLHGSPRIYYSDYDAAAIAALNVRLRANHAAGAQVWCIFDNTAAFAATGNALALSAAMNEPDRRQGVISCDKLGR